MKRTTSLTSILGVVLALAVGLTGSAHAQDFVATYWDHDPSEPGSWFNPYNWTGGVPNAWVTAYINNGGTAVINERSDGTSINGSSLGAGAQWLMLGGARSGTVIQNSGSLRVTSDIWLGRYGYGPGNYNLIDGRFSATNALIASGPAWYAWSNILPGYGSAFRQAGGASAISGTLQVGYQPYPILLSPEPVTTTEYLTQTIAGTDVDYLYRPGALYKLSAGELTTGTTYVGYGGKGRFVQSGGTHSVRGEVYVGGGTNWIYTADQTRPDPDSFYIYPSYYTDGTYLLTDGKVSAGSVHVGQRGRGRFAQSGGSVRVERTLQVGGDWWWWRPLARSAATRSDVAWQT